MDHCKKKQKMNELMDSIKYALYSKENESNDWKVKLEDIRKLIKSHVEEVEDLALKRGIDGAVDAIKKYKIKL